MNTETHALAPVDEAQVFLESFDDRMSAVNEAASSTDLGLMLGLLQQISVSVAPYIARCAEEGILIAHMHAKKMVEARVRDLTFDTFAAATVIRIRPKGFALLEQFGVAVRPECNRHVAR